MADNAASTAATPTPLRASGGGAGLVWVPCRLRAGHGVALGRNPHSPYPAGTIALQSPFFSERGIDLSPFFPGTLNLEVPGGAWRLQRPDAAPPDPELVRRWLEPLWPEAFDLSDPDLLATLAQARSLSIN
jgi:hypothetical protein